MNSRLPADDTNRHLRVAGADDPDAEVIGLVGDVYTVLVDGSQTAGAYTLIDMLVPPGGGPGPHRHDFEELFVVLEGELTLTFRGREQVVRAGQVVNVPANAPHHFRNASDAPVHMLCLCTPATQEEFFRRVGTRLDHRGLPAPESDPQEVATRMAEAARVAGDYRTELLGPQA